MLKTQKTDDKPERKNTTKAQINEAIILLQEHIGPFADKLDGKDVPRTKEAYLTQFSQSFPEYFRIGDGTDSWMSMANVSLQYTAGVNGKNGQKQMKKQMHLLTFGGMLRADFFEGLSVGHALKRCAICGRWFLTTDARQIMEIYRDQRLLEKRNAICMTCGRVSNMKTKVSFENLAEDCEGTGTPGAEMAYKRAVEKLMLELVKLGQLHCVRLKQLSIQREGKKITAAAYAYQVDNGGEWGEIQFDLEKGTAWVETFAENDPCDTWKITDAAIHAITSVKDKDHPKKMLIPILLAEQSPYQR